MSAPEFNTQVANEAFEALVSKGIYVLLFPLKRTPTGIEVDTTKNILYGYPVGGFNTGGESVESEEFQDQIRGGMYKTKVAGAIDPGDVSFNAYFNPNMGKPKIEGVINSMVITPQFALYLARKKTETTLEGFLAAGVNYAGGNDIKGDYGKIIGSSLKFAISGEPKFGYEEVGEIPMVLYTAGSDGTQIASAAPTNFDPVKTLLGSTDVPMTA